MPEHFLYWLIVPVGEVLPLPKDTRALDVKLIDVTRGKRTIPGVLLTLSIDCKTIEDARSISNDLSRRAEDAWTVVETKDVVAPSQQVDKPEDNTGLIFNLKGRVRAAQEEIERQSIREAMALFRSKTGAAEALGISRPTLDAKLDMYGISWGWVDDTSEEHIEEPTTSSGVDLNLKERVRCAQEAIEQQSIRQAMVIFRSKARASEALGIARPTLDAKLELYGIEWERSGDAPEVSSVGSQADIWNAGYRNESRSEAIDEEKDTKTSEKPASS